MSEANWKALLKTFIDASYEKVLQDIPESFEGLSNEQIKIYRRLLKDVRRRAILDVGVGVALVVGNGYAASHLASVSSAGIGTSAAGGVILFRKGGHALIRSTSSRE